MKFVTLAKMKKDANLTYHDNGKDRIFYDFSGLDKTWFTSEVMDAIVPQILKQNGSSTIESSCYCLHALNTTDGTEVYIDIDFQITQVYSQKSGKRLYTYKEVCGFRYTAYKCNIYGIAPDYELPTYTVTYGTFDGNKTYLHHGISDVEI